MARKKWTAQTEITDSLLRFREKRKWQVSYRRYVLERMPCEAYAPYFGLDTETLRNWFEIQFTEGLGWENFGKAWQFEHIIPTAYFDFSVEKDLVLCWSFINIRVERVHSDKNGADRIDTLAMRPYFENLYNRTGLTICREMLDKISAIENAGTASNPAVEDFIIRNKTRLEHIASFTQEEFVQLNTGSSIDSILLEREILKKFGN